MTAAKAITILEGTVKLEYVESTKLVSVYGVTHYARLVEITVSAQ